MIKQLTTCLLLISSALPLSAAPSKDDLQSVSSVVQELMKPELDAMKSGKKTKADVAKAAMALASQADSAAAKQLLCTDAFTYYMKAGEYESAEASLDALLAAVPDYPQDDLQSLLSKALYPVPSKDAASLRARLADLKAAAAQRQQLKKLLALYKSSPKPATATRIGYAYATLNDWPHACEYLVKSDNSAAVKAAKLELAANNQQPTSALPDAWWDAAPAKLESIRRAFRSHAATLYTAALPSLAGLTKVSAERRIQESKDLASASKVARLSSMSGIKLPYDCEVDYLQGDGKSYIDTGVVVDLAKTKVEVDETTVSANGSVFGVNPLLALTYVGNNFRYRYNAITFDIPCTPGRNTRIFEANAAYLNGKQVHSFKKVTATSSDSAFLFARRNALGNAEECCVNRIHAARIWNAGKLVRDFIPVKVEGKGALYDKVTKKLYENKGIGSFLVGDVK